ncbi:MAG: translation initiation factor IF-2 [Candidatus Pelagibacter sp.]|nr:translation initiation factor IF-2 [Candidatus Pelagibacter sp.]OUV86927.1 MAG: translation initiation factor IF-2 [Pelagibacteraceae bacterium TMED136]|tara:strand:- start:24094 stop:26274 length:2181 start_codon:yes stop_codon:yes gene_type:complete
MSKEKKKKLTLKNFKGTPRKFNDSNIKTRGKVVVERKNPNFNANKSKVEKKPIKNFAPKIVPTPSSDEKQKNAKEWAKKKIQEELFKGKAKTEKKFEGKRRDLKLTLGRALTDGDEVERQRSFASVKRAREKQFKRVDDNLDNQKIIRDVNIPEVITIQELANRMTEKASAVIKFLLEKNVKVTVNHSIDADTAEFIAGEFGHKPIREDITEEKIKKIVTEEEDQGKDPRPPIVTVMGHVDHGKTSLLDALRQANVVSTEHGGITQHIGAYQVKVGEKKLITFIDTPGHAAFTEMRARGSKITDIVILVVAADDGIKPQTIEAIKHSKAANVPIIVAVNKCDLPGADTIKIKNQLLEHELVVEEMGGDILCTEISAIKKTNLDKLKESILLQSELLDLKTKKNALAKGVIIESRLDKGKGPVSTILITSGTLNRGNTFISGNTKGKVRAMFDCNNKEIKIAEPSTPVEVIGFEGVTKAGDDFIVLNEDKKIEEILEYRKIDYSKKNIKSASSDGDDIFGNNKKATSFNIVLKADVHGSLEAINTALQKIEIEEIKAKIILSAVGPVTETDVTLAKASDAKIIGFNVRPNKEAKELSASYNIDISYFNIIYEAIDFVEKSIKGTLDPDTKEENTGQCEVLEVFNVSKAGKVAGVKVLQGEVNNNSKARLIRDGTVIYTGKIGSLFREKNEAKEVKSGLECGLTISDFLDYKKGDVIEVFKIVTSERE